MDYHPLHRYLVGRFWELPGSHLFFPALRWGQTAFMPWLRDQVEPVKWAFNRRKSDLSFQFGVFSISPTTFCNGRCVFCAYRKGGFDKSFIDEDVFKRVVDEMAKLGVKRVQLTATVGEVMLDREIYAKLAYIRSKGLTPYMYTNGLMLWHEKQYEKLVDSGIDELYISLSDFDPALETKAYGVAPALAQKKLEGIRDLARYNHHKKGKGIKHVRLLFRPSRNPAAVVREPAFQEIKDMVEYEFCFGFDNWGGAILDSELFGKMNLVRHRNWKRKPCVNLDNISVLPNGDVRLCGCRYFKSLADDLVVGNLKDATLKEIIASGRIEEVKKRFMHNDHPESCKKCTFYM